MASFPGTVRAFPIHVNTTEVIDASHVNELQDEVTALQTFTGTNPHVSTAGAGSTLGAWSGSSRTYATISDRLANIEAGLVADTHSQYARLGNTETFTGLKTFTAGDTYFGAATTTTSGRIHLRTGTAGGEATVFWKEGDTSRWALTRNQAEGPLRLRDMVNARDHATYTPGASNNAALTSYASSLAVAGNTTLSGTLGVTGATTLAATTATTLGLSGALTLAAGTGVAASTSAVGDAAGGGTSTTVARADHVHGRESFSGTAPVANTAGTGSATGTANSPARSDHVHGLTAANPTASAVGDAVAEGSATSVARSDHRHAREAFGAATTAVTVDTAGVVGAATTPSRSDHTHGVSSAAPVGSAVGDAQATGTATTVAKSDHRHAREAFATGLAVVDAAAASAGSAATVVRGDHKHSASVGSPVALQTFGLTAGDGTSTSLARADHSHGTPPAPTAASVGALALTGGTLTGALTVPSPLTLGDGTITKTAGNPFALNSGLSATTLSASQTVTGTTGVFDGAVRVYSQNNPPPSAAPVVIMPFYVGGSIGVGLRAPQFLATVPMTIRGARSISGAGSGTYQVYVNGTTASGAAASFGTAQSLHDFANVDINVGDRVQLNVASASVDAVDLSVTVDVVTR